MIIQTINNIKSKENFEKLLNQLHDSGINNFRINFGKYSVDRMLDIYNYIYYLAGKHNEYFFYIDLPFPKSKSRIIKIKNGKKAEVHKDNIYIITNNEMIFKKNDCSILMDSDEFKYEKKVLYYGDGEGAFEVVNFSDESIKVKAINTFDIYENKSISCGFSKKNEKILENMLDNNMNNIFYLLSFVEKGRDLIKFKRGRDIKVYSKIETSLGVENISEILDESEGILIARGDLAFSYEPLEFFESIQYVCNSALERNKKIIFCTDILVNSVNRIMPTRSEIFDLILMKMMGASDIVLPCTKEMNIALSENISFIDNKSMDSIKTDIMCKLKTIDNVMREDK